MNEVRYKKSTCWILFFIIFSVFLSLIYYLNKNFHPISLESDSGRIVYCILLLSWISYSLAFSPNFIRNVKYLFMFFFIMFLGIIAFTYKAELIEVKARVLSNIIPGKGYILKPNSMRFQMSEDGHFYIKASLNNTPVLFLVDTGSSDVVLTPKIAKSLGFDIAKIKDVRIYETANGSGFGYMTEIDEIKIGKFVLNKFSISINKEPMRQSLLGMSFFRKLKEYKFAGDELIINW